jgi:uncharacterized protein DUF2442
MRTGSHTRPSPTRPSPRFEDGTTGDVDLAHLADYGGVFEPLGDPAYLRELRADPEAGPIAWPNDADRAGNALRARPAAHGRDRVERRHLYRRSEVPVELGP